MNKEAAPYIQQRRSLVAELQAASPKSASQAWVSDLRFQLLKNDAELAYLGDKDASKRLDEQAAMSDAAQSTAGLLGQQLVSWWNGYGSQDQQSAIVDKVEPLAKAQPRSDEIARTLVMMVDSSPATAPLAHRINLIVKTMHSDFASRYTSERVGKIGEPITISGITFKGPSFSTDNWKGKVILVDFWATWCPGCQQEVPNVIKLYQQYHDKGLEVVGISSDTDRAVLASFLKDHPEMSWPQLFFANQAGAWHPLTKKFAVNAIPKEFLIDRNGILRSVDGVGAADQVVPKLISEAAAVAISDRSLQVTASR